MHQLFIAWRKIAHCFDRRDAIRKGRQGKQNVSLWLRNGWQQRTSQVDRKSVFNPCWTFCLHADSHVSDFSTSLSAADCRLIMQFHLCLESVFKYQAFQFMLFVNLTEEWAKRDSYTTTAVGLSIALNEKYPFWQLVNNAFATKHLQHNVGIFSPLCYQSTLAVGTVKKCVGYFTTHPILTENWEAVRLSAILQNLTILKDNTNLSQVIKLVLLSAVNSKGP